MVFTPEEVASLNAYQNERVFHPFTCASGNRTDSNHLDGEGVLLATEDGWTCPFCPYTQNWAHNWMKDWSWTNLMFENILSFISTISIKEGEI
jgi:hypothetical protein